MRNIEYIKEKTKGCMSIGLWYDFWLYYDKREEELLKRSKLILELFDKIDKAIDIYETAISDGDWSTVELDMYLVLTDQEDKLIYKGSDKNE